MGLDNVMGIVDVLDYTVQMYGTRDLLFDVDYATNVGLASSAERLDIRGGIGAPIRISADHSKTADFTSELPLVDIDALGVKLGRSVEVGATTAPQVDALDVTSSTITLTQTPLTGTLKVYVIASNGRDVVNELDAGDPATNTDEYSISSNTITVHSSIADGTTIKAFYDYTTSVNAKRVRVTAKDFPGNVRITGTGYALDESGNKSKVKFIVHKAKPTPEFEITFASGQATNIPFNCTMYPAKIDGEEVFYDLIPLPDEAY